jgi:hypothetical protein
MNKDKSKLFLKIDLIILSVILLVAFSVRLYRIDAPLADFHSWRQADTAAVARNFVKDGFDLMNPRYDDLSPIQSGKDNPQGLRMVEFPLYNAIFGGLYKLAPVLPIEVWGRIVSILFSLSTIAVVYYLCLKEHSRIAAAGAATIYAIFPYFVFFSRTVLPDTTALGLAFLAIFSLYRYTTEERKRYAFAWFVASAVSFALALLVKPTVIFYGLPIGLLFLRTFRLGVFKAVPVYLYGIIALVPLILWRGYIAQFPEGIPSSGWLITSVNTYMGLQNIFFKPAFFRWIFFERINMIILGGYGAAFLVLGALSRQRYYLLPAIGIAALTYLFVFQGGNVQHEYYQITIFPALAIFCGIGVSFLIANRKLFLHPVALYPAMAGITVLALFFSWYRVRDYYGTPNDLVQIARIVNTLTTSDDKIVTDSIGDTTLLFLMDRRGAPAPYREFDILKSEGYDYFVTMNGTVIDAKKEEGIYRVVFENDKFALFKL